MKKTRGARRDGRAKNQTRRGAHQDGEKTRRGPPRAPRKKETRRNEEDRRRGTGAPRERTEQGPTMTWASRGQREGKKGGHNLGPQGEPRVRNRKNNKEGNGKAEMGGFFWKGEGKNKKRGK